MTNKNTLDLEAIQLFEASLDLPENERLQWLKDKTNDNPALFDKVKRLYDKDQILSGQLITGQAYQDSHLHDDSDVKHPEKIGNYNVTEFIGQGGMGAVYKGERATADFDLVVAIKLIRQGVLSDPIIQRFEHERQTLANLIHPNIARLYDGGQTPEGTPYFIMEYINGCSLSSWIQNEKPDLELMLKMFVDICDAVRYAHQNLVIHRDITPSNVMVTREGQIKLIDFGIAKPLETQPSPTASEHPSLQGLSFTPGFAAPERSQQGISNTLSDIYSLGKLLEFMLKQRDIDDELASIIFTASADKPERRYKTVNALMQDIQHYLGHFPVDAFSSSPGYRFKKFSQRHKKSVFLSFAALTAIILALIISLTQYQRAEKNFAQANQRFEQVRTLAGYQLFDLYDELSRVAGTTQARSELADNAHGYLKILAEQPLASFEVKLETVQGYLRLAYIYGVPAQPNLGDFDTAKKHLQTAKKLASDLELVFPENTSLKTVKAGILAAQAMMLIHNDNDLSAAKEVIEQSYQTLDSIPNNKRDQLWFKTLRELRNASLEHADQASDAKEINRYANAWLADIQQWPDELKQSYIKQQDENIYFYWIGVAHYVAEEFEQAVAAFDCAHTALSQLETEQKNDPKLLYQLAWTNYLAFGSATRFLEAVQVNQYLIRTDEYIERLKALEERDISLYVFSLHLREAWSQTLANAGDFEKAIEIQQGVVEEITQSVEQGAINSSVSSLAFSHIILAYLYRDVDNIADTCTSLIKAEELLKPLAEQKLLPEYLDNAAHRLSSRIQQCINNQPIDSMNALFD
ncbi:serine/threonine protein kinase [Glaciecola sp. 1036]|uniref:serine/threonine protein kinase n=1 Tax=Alteromonadaceae TaxID=72275 RepID=UPI003D04F883